MLHAPFAQYSPAAHAWPQLPQFAMLVVVSTQPAPPHSIWPAPEQPHDPAVQVAPDGQVVPQPPQLSGSVPITFTHDPAPHIVVPGMHIVPHTPALQTSPGWQGMLQPAQFCASGVMQPLVQVSEPP